jgi:hypothetical protein
VEPNDDKQNVLNHYTGWAAWYDFGSQRRLSFCDKNGNGGYGRGMSDGIVLNWIDTDIKDYKAGNFSLNIRYDFSNGIWGITSSCRNKI